MKDDFLNDITLSVEQSRDTLKNAQQSLEQASLYEGKRIMICYNTRHSDKTFFVGDFVGVSGLSGVFNPVFKGYRFVVNQGGIAIETFEAPIKNGFEKLDCFLGYLPNDLSMADSMQYCFKHVAKYFLTLPEKPTEKITNLEL